MKASRQTSRLAEHSYSCHADLKVLAVYALAVVATVDASLEALAVFLQAARLLTVAALVVSGCASH